MNTTLEMNLTTLICRVLCIKVFGANLNRYDESHSDSNDIGEHVGNSEV